MNALYSVNFPGFFLCLLLVLLLGLSGFSWPYFHWLVIRQFVISCSQPIRPLLNRLSVFCTSSSGSSHSLNPSNFAELLYASFISSHFVSRSYHHHHCSCLYRSRFLRKRLCSFSVQESPLCVTWTSILAPLNSSVCLSSSMISIQLQYQNITL